MSSKLRVLELANHHNTLPIALDTKNTTVVGSTLNISRPDNIRTTLVSMPSTPYEGMVEIDYDRVNLGELFSETLPRVTGSGSDNLHAMLPWLSQELGLDLYVEDFENVEYKWLSEFEQANIPLRPHKTSLLYSGEALVHFTRRRVELTEAVLIRALESLYYPGVTTDGHTRQVLALEPLTWGIDFTEHLGAVKKHEIYPWPGNPTGLRALMLRLFGIVNYPVNSNSRMEDLPTAGLSWANKDYDRVIIHTLWYSNPTTRPTEGRSFFHYNLLDE